MNERIGWSARKRKNTIDRITDDRRYWCRGVGTTHRYTTRQPPAYLEINTDQLTYQQHSTHPNPKDTLNEGVVLRYFNSLNNTTNSINQEDIFNHIQVGEYTISKFIIKLLFIYGNKIITSSLARVINETVVDVKWHKTDITGLGMELEKFSFNITPEYLICKLF
ncbi:hypothetical protein DFA_02324 [Cavenderia fasciculata]|uniref:Uncharacterized protein n=1 Tax=Cavenderia fasciculata TaxID=261658 RepID=F4PZ49_CACFS|nr:uncharacterized protein DFA_02324 [Cavenderia fasciculata]EGG19078.1 hypothetical protein DFA_02324 [Cavenderia fasciculata]|eukprot:XP_004366711.1 hypothetical protein DFA_02324 [Cavenderia fasciculata]